MFEFLKVYFHCLFRLHDLGVVTNDNKKYTIIIFCITCDPKTEEFLNNAEQGE